MKKLIISGILGLAYLLLLGFGPPPPPPKPKPPVPIDWATPLIFLTGGALITRKLWKKKIGKDA